MPISPFRVTADFFTGLGGQILRFRGEVPGVPVSTMEDLGR
ncbi:hypothetical protein ACFWIW_30845 [Amycolatopsis sp. NPDC058340]